MAAGRLPTFLCIGAPRSGTSWLFEALKVHPQAFVPETKEVCFFIRDGYRSTWAKGLPWYQSLFDFPRDSGVRAWGELSPRYYSLDRTPQLIHGIVPDVKLILLVRHPVEMLHSLAAYHLRMYPHVIDGTCYGVHDYLDHHLAEPLGFYARHYHRFAKLFAANQIHVGLFEDLQRDATSFFNGICRFLELEENIHLERLNHRVNTARVPRRFWLSAVMHRLSVYTQWFKGIDERLNRIEFRQWIGRQRSFISSETFDSMMQVYEEDVHQLETIVDRDLSHWFEYESLDPALRGDESLTRE